MKNFNNKIFYFVRKRGNVIFKIQSIFCNFRHFGVSISSKTLIHSTTHTYTKNYITLDPHMAFSLI